MTGGERLETASCSRNNTFISVAASGGGGVELAEACKRPCSSPGLSAAIISVCFPGGKNETVSLAGQTS